jgi:XTP/dITP diphosphohydrolase
MENPTLALITSNPHKVSEWLAITQRCAPWLTVIPVTPTHEVVENGDSFEANARLKADAGIQEPTLPKHVQWVVGEDAGLVVPALTGRDNLPEFPGIYSNRWFTPSVAAELGIDTAAYPDMASARNAGLLKLMTHLKDRGAYYVSSLVCHARDAAKNTTDGGHKTLVSEGRFPGEIATVATGASGFGYDPIMLQPDGRSVAQLSADEKNTLSHRRQAIENLLAQIQQSG